MYTGMVGYWRSRSANQCRRNAREKRNQIATRGEKLACAICTGHCSTPRPDELQTAARLFAA
jgi:hypothetical protein